MLITSLVLALHVAATPSAHPATDPAVLLPISHVAKVAARLADEPDYLARAIAAQAAGDLEGARREYVVASALDRDAGRMPTQATYGLALILSEQGKYRDAAAALEALADDAALHKDDDVEARALLDALYLNSRAHRAPQARDNAERLNLLKRSMKLSPDLKKRIAKI